MKMLLAILLGLATGDEQTDALTAESAPRPVTVESAVIHVGDISFAADRVLFRSADGGKAGRFACTLDGHAKLTLFTGDIEITADRIQFEMRRDGPVSVRSGGACTFKQDDGSGEVLSGDSLTFGQDGLMITGNAAIQYGSDSDRTAAKCDSLTARRDGYELSGKVWLRHSQQGNYPN